MKSTELFLIKLGGSLITDKTNPYTARYDVIKRLAKEIRNTRERKMSKLILGHGGGSFPHTSAKKYQTHKGIINKESYFGLACVQNDAAKLNRIIIDALLSVSENAMSIQPSCSTISENSNIKEMFIKPILALLNYDMVPVVYGDVCLDLKQGCCIISTEEILCFLAKKLRNKYNPRIIMCGIVDGVFTSDPIKNPDSAKFIEKITSDNIEEVRSYLDVSSGIDVTGGMKHKVEMLYNISKFGIESIIINGLVNNNLEKVLDGKKVKGTTINL